MLVDKFIGYKEGQDLALISPQHLTYPSENCVIYKGVVQTRGGMTNDGNAPTGTEGVIGSFDQVDYLSGEQNLRAFGTKLQAKLKTKWVTIYTAIASGATRVRFAPWINANVTPTQKRVYFVDGSVNMHEWSGAVATVASVAGAGITISGTKTLLELGFDTGATTAQTIIIVRFDANGNVLGTEEKTHSDNCTDQVLTLTLAPTTAPQAGDLIIAKPIQTATGSWASAMTTLKKNEVFTYPVTNKLVVVSFDGGQVFGSDSTAKDSFVVPAPVSRVASSPFYLNLQGNITAIIGRTGPAEVGVTEVAWFSTEDKWFKIRPLGAVSDVTGQWIDIKPLDLPQRSGALPYMVSNFKGDIIFLSQERRLHKIETLEVVNKDQLTLLSDEVEGLLDRLDYTNASMHQDTRYLWVCVPADSQLLMLDMIGDPERGIPLFWNPPQKVAVSNVAVIDGVRYGHSSSKDETFTLFSGATDLGVDIQSIIALGTFADTSIQRTFLKYLTHTRIGISGKISTTTDCKVNQYYETDGAKAQDEIIIDGETVKSYTITDDNSWGVVPWASKPNADWNVSTLKRFFAFSENSAVSYFEQRPIFTITGSPTDFRLIGFDVNVTKSEELVGGDLFISR